MFQLEVSTKLTKEYLYSEVGQERIMEFYLGVPVKKGLFVCPSIIRKDTKPTCSFYKNSKGSLIFKDFAGISGDCITIVMNIFQCSYYQALKIIANDFNLVSYSKVEKNTPKMDYTGSVLEKTLPAIIQVDIKDYIKEELDWWESFGITLGILKYYKVYSLKSVILNGKLYANSTKINPIYGYYGGKNTNKIELWRIYMPMKKEYRFLNNWSSSILQGVKQLPAGGENLIITKSLKDVMTLHYLNIPSVAPTSETIVISLSKFKKLQNSFNNVLCFYDNDLAGVKGAKKYKKEYNIRCIFIKRKYAKDISDLFKSFTHEQMLEVKKELDLILTDKTIKKTKHFYII